MAEISMESCYCIPTVDLSPFFHEGDADGRKAAAAVAIGEACRNYGFFRLVNHSMPKSLMARALELSQQFFNRPEEEKMQIKMEHRPGGHLPSGYDRQPESSPDKNEFLMIFSPEFEQNLYPANPSEFRSVLEDCFKYLSKTSVLVEEILNEGMGLPPQFLRECNKDGSTDFLVALRYFPATDSNENSGVSEHQDGNCLTFVFQDNTGGLEVLMNGYWIPVDPIEGSIIVNVGDIIQVLSNNKFKSATHRVMRGMRDRYSFAFFFHHVEEGRWVEPLPQFSTEIKESPKYRKFLYKEYLNLRMTNKTHPPFWTTITPPTLPPSSSSENNINISHYAINDPKQD